MNVVPKYLDFIGSSMEKVFNANLEFRPEFDMIKYFGLRDGLFKENREFLHYLTDEREIFRYAIGYSEGLRFRAWICDGKQLALF